MKKLSKEIIILILQLCLFYIFPLFAGPTDTMGLVVIIMLMTLILSISIGIISNNKIKYLYPIITSILFIPSIFIYYNISALIHSLWYFTISIFGMALGTVVHILINKK